MNEIDIFSGAPQGATPDELGAYLEQACGGNTELQRKVEELFAAAGTVFLGRRPRQGPAGIISEAAAEQPGDRIGRYKLLQQIGEGGFGVVYLAEQEEPVRRRVALKVIKAGMDTREVIARFEAERQALAMMDHPNIAQVLDAGATAGGRPFFVMELVKGIPVTQFCDEKKLGTRERLALFADICGAINHAHQKGVIHRDIKPSNVMVTLQGDLPVVKVIDFGIAKATQSKLTDKTLFTRLEQFIGTPAYMSPEQAALSGLDIDTRSDIYALGILLYELLTGKPPFDPQTLLSAGYDEMRRIIREVEPPKPSARLSTVLGAERTTIASARHIAPDHLRRLVEPDLDWIVMKAIEKDRTRRYETANAFALDIQHFLADEPVSASPPGAVYLLRKFTRRHKAGLRIAAVIALLLVAATVVSTLLAIRATEAEKALAKQLSVVAQERDATALARGDLGDVLRVLIEMPTPERAQKDDAVAMALLRDRVAVMEDIFARMEKRSTLRDAATLWVMGHLASLLEATGDQARAVKLREEAARVSLDFLGPENTDALGAKIRLASTYEKAERFGEAARLREELLPVLERVHGHSNAVTTWVRFSLLKQYERADEKASLAGKKPAHAEDVVRLRRAMLAASAEKHGAESIAALHLRHNLAYEISASGDKKEGLRKSRETLDLARQLPSSPDNDMFLRYSVWCLAWHCGENQLKEEADRLNAELISLRPVLRPVRSSIIGEAAPWLWFHPRDGTDPEKAIPGFHAAFPRREFDDSQWTAAAMERQGFGYGKGFVGVDIGTPASGYRYAAYFRCHFTTAAPLSRLELRARRDDGLVVYLDGKEIVRDNVPNTPDSWKLDATQGVNDNEVEVTMAWPVPGELPAGEHVLAISLHNYGSDSSDLRLGQVTLVELESGQ